QHALGEIAKEEISLLPKQDRLELGGPLECLAVGQLALGVHRLAADFGAPAADRVEHFQAEPGRVELRVARRTARVAAVLLEPLPERLSIPRPVVLRQDL